MDYQSYLTHTTMYRVFNDKENTPIYSSVVLFDSFFLLYVYIYCYIFGLLPTLSLIKN